MQPTDQQLLVLHHYSNAVIIAAPGSGKTFVISEKIKGILQECRQHQGVIAISYTNKASSELKDRCLRNGLDPKASFFGTLDKFYIGEIIIPFGKHLWGIPANEISVKKIESLDEEQKKEFAWFNRDILISEIKVSEIELLASFFYDGVIFLETVGLMANFVLSNSKACQNYLLARYLAVYIDEYQDCGENQHSLFETIVELGIVGVAVGDLNQSIYGFSGKSSKHLSSLTNKGGFKTFKLDKNHRCTPSIINYSNYLLSPTVELLPTDRLNVKHIKVLGDELKIAEYIDRILPKISEEGISNNQIAILTRGNRTADIVHSHLKTPSRLLITTDLDTNLNIWSGIFSSLLRFALDPSYKFAQVIEEFTAFDRLTLTTRRQLVEHKSTIKKLFALQERDITHIAAAFIAVAEIIAPNSRNRDSINLLSQVVNLNSQLDAYRPTSENDIVIMTLHKSKGLEFDVVFHLDLYEWVFPQKGRGANNDIEYGDYHQDLNLHYVGITRARKACFLMSSTERTTARLKTIPATDSEFLWKDGIKKLRK